MKVSEAINVLRAFPQDHELLDEYGEQVITGFHASDYADDDGEHEYVAYETMDNE